MMPGPGSYHPKHEKKNVLDMQPAVKPIIQDLEKTTPSVPPMRSGPMNLKLNRSMNREISYIFLFILFILLFCLLFMAIAICGIHENRLGHMSRYLPGQVPQTEAATADLARLPQPWQTF